MENKRDKGNKGEDQAVEYLINKGYKILDRNYYVSNGELDIIALDGAMIVFIEVKARGSRRYGEAREAVHWQKQQKLYHTAQLYLHQNKYYNMQCRFDIIEVYFNETEPIVHIEAAFDGNDVEG